MINVRNLSPIRQRCVYSNANFATIVLYSTIEEILKVVPLGMPVIASEAKQSRADRASRSRLLRRSAPRNDNTTISYDGNSWTLGGKVNACRFPAKAGGRTPLAAGTIGRLVL